MAKHNAANARIKREYFHYLKEAGRRSEASIDAVAKALDRFEQANGHKDFRKFHRAQAVAFKRRRSKPIRYTHRSIALRNDLTAQPSATATCASD